ncbi:MFS family permease [Saccharothrix tamanrassetensis]|uniref:MFS family permease n=1 Tax=Saccharothrix tamanrassetensis TaxID=1051531 RepID=A0A841CHA0_9PSEU|nr:MFS transporter [Saccharothrix tamanrassetensis]MBB5956761.1 MFS family permease [Saccharothrix tamanrassetensis]
MSDATLGAPPRKARVATAIVFAVHASVFGAWTPHIPAVKEHLGLNDGTLGLTLLGAPVGSVVAMLLAGNAVARWGSRRVVLLMLLGYGLVSPALGLAWSAGALFAALALWGAFQGALDVAMNSQGIAVEQGYRRPILSGFHAWWSFGGFVGVGLGALLIGSGVDLTTQMLVSTGVVFLAAWPLTRAMLGDDHAVDDHRLGLPWRDKHVLVLGAIMFAGLLCEGAVGDWAALYLKETVGVTAESAGWGYAVFAVLMFVGRVMGDRWVLRFGASRVVATLAAAGALGLGVALVVGGFWSALVGFGLFGLGLACIVPVAFSSAAAQSDAHAGQAIAGVATAGWAGFLLGPPLIGLLAHGTSQTLALGILPLLCLAVVFGARALNTR